VTTDLFAVAAGLDPGDVLGAVPPACRRSVAAAPAARIEDGVAVLDLPAWAPRTPSRHLVPALSALAASEYSVRFELSIETGAAWSAWVASASLGPERFAPLPGESGPLRCEVDVFHAAPPAARARLRIRLRTGDPLRLLAAPWLATLSACDLAPEAREDVAEGRAAVAVPAWSQMEEAAHLRHRICSPTSVAMALGRWGYDVEPAALAAEMLHSGLGLYGVWPAAIRAAGRRGVPGYLLRFPDWASAAWCLRQGLPIVASVRYAQGELTGAAAAETTGHLLVLTGYDGDDVLVNDPAAPARSTVARRYRLAELRRVWLERSGIGYVFFNLPGARNG
jgi:hypothetical protein